MLEQRFKINAPSCIAEAVEDDLIVINLQSGRYYSMRGEAVSCWHALTQGVTPKELVDANRWDNAQLSCFIAYVQCLIDEHILVLADSGPNSCVVPTIDICHAGKYFQVDVFTDMEEMLLLDPIHEVNANLGWPHKA